jgi:hypothetical protein
MNKDPSRHCWSGQRPGEVPTRSLTPRNYRPISHLFDSRSHLPPAFTQSPSVVCPEPPVDGLAEGVPESVGDPAEDGEPVEGAEPVEGTGAGVPVLPVAELPSVLGAPTLGLPGAPEPVDVPPLPAAPVLPDVPVPPDAPLPAAPPAPLAPELAPPPAPPLPPDPAPPPPAAASAGARPMTATTDARINFFMRTSFGLLLHR